MFDTFYHLRPNLFRGDTFYHLRPILPSVTHFTTFNPFFQVWHILSLETDFFQGDTFYHLRPVLASVTHFTTFDPFFQLWHILPTVAHLTICDQIFRRWHILPLVTYFSMCDTFYYLWLFFSCVTHFLKFKPFFPTTIKANDTLEHQPAFWSVSNACAQTYYSGSGSHGQAENRTTSPMHYALCYQGGCKAPL